MVDELPFPERESVTRSSFAGLDAWEWIRACGTAYVAAAHRAALRGAAFIPQDYEHRSEDSAYFPRRSAEPHPCGLKSALRSAESIKLRRRCRSEPRTTWRRSGRRVGKGFVRAHFGRTLFGHGPDLDIDAVI